MNEFSNRSNSKEKNEKQMEKSRLRNEILKKRIRDQGAEIVADMRAQICRHAAGEVQTDQ